MYRSRWTGEEIAEVYCFVCKDGEGIRVCDFKNCLKVYHPRCVGKEDSFLNSEERFICDLHKCVNCKRDSDHHCLCCPSSSVCSECFEKAEFAQLSKLSQSKKGLCNNCLKLAMFVENADTNSDEEMEDYLVLFRDYWEETKDREGLDGLKLLDLQEASVLLKWRLNSKQKRDSEKSPNEDFRADGNPLGDSDGAEQTFLVDTNVQPSEAKVSLKRKKSNKKTYDGWGSKELIEFLSCIGKDTTKPLDQFGVTQVIKEYVQQKNLFQDRKKKSVICDDKLHSLFRKKKLKSNMIHSLLEIHLAENAASEDECLDCSEDDEDPIMKKKRRNSFNPEISKRDLKRDKNCFAALNQNNLKLIYLRRTLVMNLLSHQDTFEQKVVGSLVRVKNDTKSYSYQMSKKPFQLGLVTGIKKSSQEYKIKDTHTNILLCVTNMSDEVKISMLSAEDIEEDECNDLLLLAKTELFKRPTVAELEEKAASIHVDIVNHWIDKELMRLDKEIERAHEKGWRHEMHDLLDKRKLLRTQDERQRRLAEVPKVIPDIEEEKKEDDFEVARSNHFEGNKGATGVDSFKVSLGEHVVDFSKVDVEKSQEGATEQVAGSLEVATEKSPEDATDKLTVSLEVVEEETAEGASEPADTCEVALEGADKAICNGGAPSPGLQNQVQNDRDGGTTRGIDVGNDKDGDASSHLNGGDRVVIDLDSDEDEYLHPEQHEPERAAPHTPGTPSAIAAPTRAATGARIILPIYAQGSMAALGAVRKAELQPMWNYLDPQGNARGPFAMAQMRQWHQARFFPPDFRVWRIGQTQDQSILLTDAMAQIL